MTSRSSVLIRFRWASSSASSADLNEALGITSIVVSHDVR
jgi:hypothetical protein